MTTPYTARILAALPGHDPVELARYHRRIFPHDVHAVTADLSPEWEVFGEYPLSDKQCITSRPKFGRPTGAAKLKLHLSHGEKVGAGISS